MGKEGKVNFSYVILLSILIFAVYAAFVVGTIPLEFPVNNTNASATIGFGGTSFPSMHSFNGSNATFSCNITSINSTSNITRVVLFINKTSEQLDNNSAVINQTDLTVNHSSTSVYIVNFTVTTAFDEGTYAWMCQQEGNISVAEGKVINQSGTNFFTIDYSGPGYTNLSLTQSTSVSTGDRIDISVNFTDAYTTIHTVRLFVNISGTADNEVNTTGGTSGVTAGNSTGVNLSYVIPSYAVGRVLNFTLWSNDSVNNYNITSATILTVTGDGTVPGPINLSAPINLYNQTDTTVTFEFYAHDNNDTSLNCNISIMNQTGDYVNITDIEVTNATLQSNSITLGANQHYNYSITCWDSVGNVNTSVTRNFTIDNMPPIFDQYNITHNATSDFTDPIGIELGLGDGLSTDQGRTIYARANWTDSLTQPLRGLFQFYNTTSEDSVVKGWQTLNESPVAYLAYNNASWTNFSFPIPIGRNEFEGRNVSFRIITNDTLGNVNDSVSVKNFTIQINDSYAPTITINGTIAENGTNISATNIAVVSWAVDENNLLSEINVSVDGAVNNVDGCDKFARYTSADGPLNVELYRNYSFATSTNAACTLENGSHFIEVQARDSWSNVEVVFHNFTIETGIPTISLSGFENGTSGGTNKSTVTPRIGINFTATNGGVGKLVNFTWTSSCNGTPIVISSSVGDFPAANLTFIYPFNITRCPDIVGTEANRTVTIIVIDDAGNTQTAHYQFAVDDLVTAVPVIHFPPDGYSTTGLIELNVSAFDQMSRIDTIGYYLDGGLTILNHTINGTPLTAAQGLNTSIWNRTMNFTAGTHTIKITVNDTMGNQRNSSEITFTQTASPIKPDEINTSMNTYITTLLTVPSNATIKVKGSGGDYQEIGSSNETDANRTFEIFLNLNSSNSNDNVNVTITEINGSGANWDKINFSVFINETKVEAGIENNFTVDLFDFVWFNGSIDEFLSNANDYYGTVLLPFNISGNISTAEEIWYFPDENDLTNRTNVSICTSVLSSPYVYTRTDLTPCWNYTGGGKTLLFVPHFSGAGGGNDSRPPTVDVNNPTEPQTEASFLANITVSNDAILCNVSYNLSDGSSIGNTTMSGPSTFGNAKICTYSFDLRNGTLNNNMSFHVLDANGNWNTTIFNFSISDTTPHNMTGITISSVTSTGAKVTVTANESVNLTIYNSTVSTQLTSSHYTNVSTFAKSQSITFGGTTNLATSTTYNFTVQTCDKAGNCLVNYTVGFKTSAAATTTTIPATTSSSGGGGGGAVSVSKVADSSSQMWSIVPAGSSFSLNVDKAAIAVTSVAVSEVKSELKNVDLEVQALKENPISTEAAAKVYQYLRINKKNLKDTDAESLKIGFRVTKAWLTENSLASGDISLYRYKDGKWNELTTSVTGTDNTYVNYEAETPGFSSFAVGVKSGVEVEEVPEEEVVPAEEVPEEVAPPEEVTEPEAVVAPSKAPMAWIIAAIVIILGIVLIVAYQKKKQQV